MQTPSLDPDTERAVQVFLQRISSRYDVAGAILFGSRARHNHQSDSDADIAVILHGPRGERVNAAIDMAGIAFDVLLETGVLVEALPLWEDEWEHPQRFNNPILIENIRREGVRL
jgi:predicted nucleotidyltransferase